MNTTPPTDGRATLPASITLDEHERRVLRDSGHVGLGRLDGWAMGPPDADGVRQIRAALLVADHIGVSDDDDASGQRRIDDAEVIRDLRDGVLSALEGGFADDAYDFCDADTRDVYIAVERKLGIDRFGVARRYSVHLDARGWPEDRRNTTSAERNVLYFVAREFDKQYGDVEHDLDERSVANLQRVRDLLLELGRPTDSTARPALATAVAA